jgi:UDP-N-acetylglucosamine 2-epimerase
MKNTSLIIIEERGQIDALISLAKGKPAVIALNDDVGQELTTRGVEFKTPGDYGLSEDKLEEEGLIWFRSFADIKIKDNKNLKELIVHDGLSVWWYVEDQIYLNRFVFPRMMHTIKQAMILDRIIKAEEPALVCYAKGDTNGTDQVWSFSSASRVIEFMCKFRTITTATVSNPASLWRLPTTLKKFMFIYGQWLRILLRKTYWILLTQRHKTGKLIRGRKILIFSGPSWVDVFDPATGEMGRGDPYFDSVIELLRGKYEIIFIDTPTNNWGLANMKERKQQTKIICKPLEHYLNTGVVIKALKESKKLHRVYESVSQSASFVDSLNYHGIPLYNLVKDNLSLIFSRQYLTLLMAIIEAAKRVVAIESPDAIMLGGESFTAGRSVIASARAKGVPTLLLQHGANDRYSLYYNHIEADIGPNKEAGAPYCPLPDKFAMSDGYTKDILIRYGKIPEADVVVNGTPRYDLLATGNKGFNRERTLRRLKLDPEKKLIVWTVQTGHWTSSVNERYVTTVYGAVKSLKDVLLLIKLHPNENKNSRQVKNIYCHDKSLKPPIIGGWGDITYELLYASDIVISHNCSTAVEALTIGKPVIIMDFAGESVPIYAERGAALFVDKEDALLPAIKSLLYDEEARQKLGETREQFISEGKYRQDGQASQRVADLVLSMIEESKNKKRR